MPYFDLFCEFIHCYDDVCESTFGFLKWTYQTTPHIENRQVISVVWS
jgi:hypothetical protein